ncbi:MAG: pantoate--beta-alanine ligase [Acidimicrobiales bacterium]
MEIVHEIAELRRVLDAHRTAGRSIGFAPTMGALHAGHGSLLASAAGLHDVGVGSIFVNPLQFAPGEDLDTYPKTLEADAAMAEAAGIDLLFVPSVREMYPVENWTTVSLRVVTEPWEGPSRPTHLDGVATVVTKLFNIVGPCHAYFGEKDFQQLAMITRMVFDLDQPITVVGRPTVREPDGLAMSSRNLRLHAEDRVQAPVLSRALSTGIACIEGGERSPAAVEVVVRDVLATADRAAEPDYVAVVDADSLRTPDELSGEVRILTAVRFGDVRLIDNMGTTIS